MNVIAPTESDETLVTQSLQGNREAFGGIVRRYQALVASLAFSSTGSVAQSEDLAQETFLTAWRQLRALREPAKLRPWLCRIARNLTADALKKEGRSPLAAPEPLEAAELAVARELSPPDHAITREEEAILWRALSQIPDLYREPLILFYREQQSVAGVAAALELTEDAVKQRLTRGRRMLQEQVQGFVENTLNRTAPGAAFTQGVLMALPGMSAASTSFLAATLGKGASFFLKTGGAGMIVAGNYAGYRASLSLAGSEAERIFIRRFYKGLVIACTLFSILLAGLIWAGVSGGLAHRASFVVAVFGVMAAALLTFGGMAVWSWRERKRVFAASRVLPPAWEYRSNGTFLGLPLVHIKIGGNENVPVRAWIAAGNFALSPFFAFGGLAVAPFAIGGCGIGLAAWGGMVFGILGVGGFAIAGWTVAGMGLGWETCGGMAIAWKAAWGGIAVAHEMASGALSFVIPGGHAGTARYFNDSLFFRAAQTFLRYSVFLNILWVLPMIGWWRVAAKKRALA